MSQYPDGSAARLIEVALAEVGYKEGPANNETKFQDGHLPWCGAFLNWCARKAKVQVPNCISTIDGANAFIHLKQWHADPRIGDFVFFDFIEDNQTVIQHIGLVLRVSETQIVTVEGNTSKAGSQANGGEVVIKTRKLGPHSFVVGYGRPIYTASAPLPERPTKEN